MRGRDYFRAGWVNFLSSRNFWRYATLIPKAWWTDILAQTFGIPVTTLPLETPIAPPARGGQDR